MQVTSSEALVPNVINNSHHKTIFEIISVLLGICLIGILAQISIPLPWTPVPITGQTFGVALVALSWGRRRALSVLVGYMTLGMAGLPLFALGKSGQLVGPSLGYLVGMVFSSYIVGFMSDKWFTKSLAKTLIAAFCGSIIIFSCGLIGLSFFVPSQTLLAAGLFPFIPGDIAKNLLASIISWKLRKRATF